MSILTASYFTFAFLNFGLFLHSAYNNEGGYALLQIVSAAILGFSGLANL